VLWRLKFVGLWRSKNVGYLCDVNPKVAITPPITNQLTSRNARLSGGSAVRRYSTSRTVHRQKCYAVNMGKCLT
ncbi:MAG: hypothetical protein LBT32_01865, partial [Peptococcaceae bacterium]|nr:hypothetical protein [Peptococcaceae bacterium]